jgi:hypothetical protein
MDPDSRCTHTMGIHMQSCNGVAVAAAACAPKVGVLHSHIGGFDIFGQARFISKCLAKNVETADV